MENNKTFHFQGKEIQIKVVNNEPWFLAADIAKALSNTDVSNMVKSANIKDYHVRTYLNRTLGGEQKMLFVDEAGMYKILMKSRKAVADEFQDWVTEKVLPSIRKTGSYSVNQATALPLDYELQLIRAKTELMSSEAQRFSSEAEKFSQEQKLLNQKQSFYEMMVNHAINFEERGDLKLAAIMRTSISNATLSPSLVETKSVPVEVNTDSNALAVVENKLIDVPESAIEVSIRLGFHVPSNYESALGKAVKKKCEDLLIGKSSRYSTANDIKLNINVYPPKNKRVEDAVIAYCKNKNFSRQPSLSIVK